MTSSSTPPSQSSPPPSTLLPSYLPAAAHDPLAIITARAAEKTAKHAAGSAARNRLFLPWVLTTFGGMGPPAIWHYIDTIYATSASLAHGSRTSRHQVAARKADFLALIQAVLTRTCFAMLTAHTAEHASASAAPADAARQPPPPAADSPAASRATTPEPAADPPT